MVAILSLVTLINIGKANTFLLFKCIQLNATFFVQAVLQTVMTETSRGFSEIALRAYLQRPDVQRGLNISAIGYVYVQPCICLIGFILNVISTCVFCRKTFTSTPAYMLVLALSIADAITLGLRIPQGLI